jgi:hypothetical protein
MDTQRQRITDFAIAHAYQREGEMAMAPIRHISGETTVVVHWARRHGRRLGLTAAVVLMLVVRAHPHPR